MRQIIQKSQIGFLFVSLLVLIIGVFAYKVPGQQADEGVWVMHTHEVLTKLETLSRHLTDAESSERGYLLTGSEQEYASYKEAGRAAKEDVNTFRQLTHDNPRQQAEIPTLLKNVNALLATLETSVDSHRLLLEKQKAKPAKNSAANSTDKAAYALQPQLDRIRTEELRLLDERLARWHSSVEHSSLIFLGGVALLYTLISVIFTVLQRESTSRNKLLALEKGETERLTEIVALQRDIAVHRLDLQAAMESIVERTQVLTHADGAIVELVDGDEMVYRAASGTGSPHVGLRIKASTSLSGRCIAENIVMKCDDARTDDRVDKVACERVGLRSMVVVPLRHNAEPIGVLKVLSARPNAFLTHDVATLELMAATLSATISDASASDALQQLNESLRQANMELAYQKTDLEEANERLQNLATTDGLTGIKNHRTFQEELAKEFQRSNRYKLQLSVILIDVDHFKSFNDTYGHPAGDAVLKRVAELLTWLARTTDCVARYGGEEFVVILPETGEEGALLTAERIRKTVSEASWERGITVSIGVSTLLPATENAAMMIAQADRALYHSKANGRNRITHSRW